MDGQLNTQWVEIYQEFASKLVEYQHNREKLIEKIQNVFEAIDIGMPKLEKDNNLSDIDPFTVITLFNKRMKWENRGKIIEGIKNEFNLLSPTPISFDGIPVVTPQKATFYHFVDDREKGDIDKLWRMFLGGIRYAEISNAENRKEFISAFDEVLTVKGVKWNITMGLYWARPYMYLNLDKVNRQYLLKELTLESINLPKLLKKPPTGEEYLNIMQKIKEVIADGTLGVKDFPELSYEAWLLAKERPNRYWIYTLGDRWDELHSDGVIVFDIHKIGDLSKFKNKSEFKKKIQKEEDISLSFTGDVCAIWKFAKEIQVDDIIYVKEGETKIIARGKVTSDYMYSEIKNGYGSMRKVDWSDEGEWEYLADQLPSGRLIDITSNSDLIEGLNNLINGETDQKTYTEQEFLDEVFMSKERYDVLKNVLLQKKNIILQGAPGVGKSFIATRLAYSIIGKMDTKRVQMIQFHQNYSYEDFIMGYRPKEDGFYLKEGPFYSFCKEAEKDDINTPYFFIIDEINRGNISKIFGELFVLIEKDKRGLSMPLLYSEEKFKVPENVHIIGMMNTADRSLAMLDYALRRRFAFFDLPPAFENLRFLKYKEAKSNDKYNRLIAEVERLNEKITEDETLGLGFRIGHSYFCTDKKVTDIWLKSVVEYELIPLLSEYWFDEPAKIDSWSERLREALK